MEIQYLREWIHLTETRSYSRSAEELHISQSSLSRHIQMLEKELGEALFIRSTRKIELTDFGMVYLPLAKKITAADDNANKAVSSYLKTKNSMVTLGISQNPHLYQITESLRSFRNAWPDIPVRILEGSIQDLRRELQDGTLHIATTAYPKRERPRFDFIPAGRSMLVAVIPQNHYLSSYDTLPLHRLSGVNLMVPAKDSLFFHELTYHLSRDGIAPNIVYQGSYAGGLSLLKDGMGILIADRQSVLENRPENTAVLPLSPEISYTFGLEYTGHLSRNEHIFVKHIRSLFPET